MAAIRGSHTKPEIMIRKTLHAAGFRFRLHVRDLPGKPDLVFPKYQAVIFVNGCFWHHHDCHLFKWPATRDAFWREKIGRNVENDAMSVTRLQAMGWRVATVWECALRGKNRLAPTVVTERLTAWLKSDNETLTVRGE